MSELKNCPFCGGKVEIDMLDSENSRNVKIYSAVHCPECHEWFFKGLSRGKTIEHWNRRAQPENEPLTLDELRQMGGEPVWIQELVPYTFAGYKILCSPVVDEYEDVCFEGGDCYYSHDYGDTWLAYRYKKGVADER